MKITKQFIILVSFVIITIPATQAVKWRPATREQVFAVRDRCIYEYQLAPDLAARVQRFDFPNDPNVHRVIRCSAIRLSLFDDVNGFNPRRLANQVGRTTPQEVNAVTACLDHNEQRTSVDEWAWRNYRCVLDSGLHMPNRG